MGATISYCIAAYRPVYSRRLIDDLIRKTTVPCEILVWLNVDDAEFKRYLESRQSEGAPIRIVGRSPENIGMTAYRHLFEAARHEMIVQIDDDVVCVSRGIAERAARIFQSFPRVRQLVADVWQDEWTTGARPPMSRYRCIDPGEGLFEGPIDGWFSIYHRSVLPLVLGIPTSEYCPIGGVTRGTLKQRGLVGALCTRMKVFHVMGPDYVSAFGMLDFEIEKYRRLGRSDMVNWYEGARPGVQPAAAMQQRVTAILEALDAFEADNMETAKNRRPGYAPTIRRTPFLMARAMRVPR
jgi:hypothetical protein